MVSSEKLNAWKPAYDVGLEQIWSDKSGQLHHWLCKQNGFNFMLRKSLIHVGDSCEEGKNLCPKAFVSACGRRPETEADETSCFCS